MPLTESDRGDIELLYANQAVREFLGGTVDKDAFAIRFARFKKATEERHWTVRLKEDLTFLGIVSLDTHHDGHDKEISYQFMPQVWGKGFATEVVGGIMNYSLREFGLPRIVAETQTANDRSRRLLERLGMMQVRTLIRCDAEQVIYAKLAMVSGN